MPIHQTFSRRKRHAEKSEPDVFQYDEIPDTLRYQVIRIFENSLGYYQIPQWNWFDNCPEPCPENNQVWGEICDTVAQELGRPTLVVMTQTKRPAIGDNRQEECFHFLRSEESVEHWLDLVEYGVQTIDKACRQYSSSSRRSRDITQKADDAIEELNFRFLEAQFGYQYEAGQIVRFDSQLIHNEVTKPALQLLADTRFTGPQEEFLVAHKRYRARKYKDCITNALNAFESTLKTICDLKGWTYQPRARASDLVKVIRREKLLPDYLDKSFDQLIATLTSGLPKVRNEAGGHGQGAVPWQTPSYVAAYALHLAAADIVLLVDAFRANEGE